MRHEGGFVFVTVLLLGTLILVGVSGLSRHALLSKGHSIASLRIHEAREGNASSVAYARQHLASGSLPDSTVLTTGGSGAVDVTITSLGQGRYGLRAESIYGDLGDTLEAEFEALPDDETLPSLESTLAARLRTDPGATWLDNGAVLADQTLTGTYIVRRGASVVLRDVLLQGTLLSEPSLAGPPYDFADATTVRVEGGLRISPLAGALDDVALFLPDGAMLGTADSRLEIDGVVAVDSLSLLGSGYLHHHVVANTTGLLAAGVEQPGSGRTPRPWPPALAHTSFSMAWMAIPPADATLAQIAAIEGFAFP